MTKLTYLVLIRHNRNIAGNLPSSLLRNLDSLETVWTDEAFGQFIEKPNESFEFSGYQEGLLRILNKQIFSCDKEKKKKIRIIIANDTIFSGHFYWLTIFVIYKFLSLNFKFSNSSAICTGLAYSVNSDIKCIVQVDSYISSWLFMLEGTHLELSKLILYDKGLELSNFSLNYYSSLPLPYRQSVDEWLQPSRFMRGWYQAAPGHKLPQSSIDRKRFTIYLEHTLPLRVQESGFQVVCLSQRLAIPAQKKLLSLLRFMDRCYVNLIKLRYRLLALFHKIVKV